jgi:hypothetical protein
MRNNNRLLLATDVVTVLSCQHVELTLVHAELANVSLQEKDISTLHARVENLGAGHVVALSTSHDLSAALYSGNVVLARDVNHSGPVLFRSAVDLL